MPLTTLHPNSEGVCNTFNPLGGTPAGSKSYINAPWRGVIREVGFMPNSVVTSGMTLSLAVNYAQISGSQASNYVQVLTSTVGTFASQVLFEGAVASVSALNFTTVAGAYVNQGDTLQFTTSGGQSSTVGVTCYAIIGREGVG